MRFEIACVPFPRLLGIAIPMGGAARLSTDTQGCPMHPAR